MTESTDMSEDEIVSYLATTSLPTVLVEGVEDMGVFRWLDSHLGIRNCSVMPCGGRSTLLKVFARRNEFPSLRGCFLADRDMWVYDRIPTEYSDVIFTAGYSIENDILDCQTIERLYDAEDQAKRQRAVAALCGWFAFEVAEHCAGRACRIDLSLQAVLDQTQIVLRSHIAPRSFDNASPQVRDLEARWKSHLRGKLVVDIHEFCLSGPTRAASHNGTALIEMALKLGDLGEGMQRIAAEVRRRLAHADVNSALEV